MNTSNIGVFGLGVMGRNLALNLESRGFQVSVFNRMDGGEEHITKNFLRDQPESSNLTGTYTLEGFVNSLEAPRKILIMVSAGKAVDAVISQISPLLEDGDILIDGGNSHYPDTQRRVDELNAKGIRFVGMGVSGGEEGARFGPSLMPGGNDDAWLEVKDYFQAIAAKTSDGFSCCRWIGGGGSGHFVKMVHNGIEYADMQLIAEMYHLMKSALGMNAKQISAQFNSWNSGDLSSFLMEITTRIFKVKDTDGKPLVEKIKDAAGQKGTGRWTVISALEHGIPLPIITEAVYSRSFSALKNLRTNIGDQNSSSNTLSEEQKKALLSQLPQAMLATRLMILAEGLYMIQNVSDEQNWGIDLAEVARIWRAGCIIRSSLLDVIIPIFEQPQHPEHLLTAPAFVEKVRQAEQNWRGCIQNAIAAEIPVPAMNAALAQYDSLRCSYLPANLIQAQRDFFGAHTYQRLDQPDGAAVHTNWGE